MRNIISFRGKLKKGGYALLSLLNSIIFIHFLKFLSKYHLLLFVFPLFLLFLFALFDKFQKFLKFKSFSSILFHINKYEMIQIPLESLPFPSLLLCSFLSSYLHFHFKLFIKSRIWNKTTLLKLFQRIFAPLSVKLRQWPLLMLLASISFHFSAKLAKKINEQKFFSLIWFIKLKKKKVKLKIWNYRFSFY